MDHVRFRSEFEALCERTEGLLRAAAHSDDSARDLAHRTFETLQIGITAMQQIDAELERLDRELMDAYRRADLERRRYQHLFMTTAEPEVLTDARGTIVEANAAAGELFGVALEDLAGKPLPVFVASRDRARLHGMLRALRRGAAATPVPLICHTIARDRQLRCQIRVQRIEVVEPGDPSLRWGLRDLSQEERAAERDALVEQAARKDQFLAALGHELRNPLAAITLASDLVRRDLEERAVDRARSGADVIARHAEQLARLVDDLLDAARVRHGKIELRCRTVELSEVVAHAIETVQPVMRTRQQEIALYRHSGPVWVRGDATRLQQVVANLLHNAAKYSPPGARIEVALQATDEVARLAVRDEGAGIPAHQLDAIFGLFEQAEVPCDTPGLGLGLSLARALIELHGGEVCARSDGPGRGSEFVVSLPRLPVRETAPDESGPLAAVGAPISVLVADDNVDSAEILGLALRQLGHDVVVATSGREAIERAAERPFAAALLDLAMPDIDGFELARRLRGLGRDIRLIAVTGYGDERNRQRAAAAGFESYLLKPIDLRALDALLRQAP